MNPLIAIVCLSFVIASCSHKNIYEAVKVNQTNECTKLPQNSYAECIDRVDKPYDEYERDRQILIENGNSL
ncbi:hypothetical protein [Candidatus Albibeggiatoa sp. nov. BB20]|uniref:hypothetical protein n=1 Tax=Candidatus Albibeggiatoa sp. nov. BB20 TaxID=3162723 RepID=UPI0033657FB8